MRNLLVSEIVSTFFLGLPSADDLDLVVSLVVQELLLLNYWVKQRNTRPPNNISLNTAP